MASTDMDAPLHVSAMPGLFAFEQDGRYPLRRIPMTVRFKLDTCGIRIALEAWVALERAQREALLLLEPPAFRDGLLAMLALHGQPHEDVPPVDVVTAGPVPANLVEAMQALGLAPPALPQWQALAPLQRFTLQKLSRPGHQNSNLPAALGEFRLA